MKFQLPKLPYELDALEPFMTADQLKTHYRHHHQSYIDKVNTAIQRLGLANVTLEKLILNHDGDLFNNAAQAWNHTFFWYGLTAASQPLGPDSAFLKAVKKHFTSLDDLKQQLMDSAANLFGSGYTWIVSDESGDVQIMNTHNGDTPLRLEHTYPLWTCDIWEHSYYIDYRQDRKKYLSAVWDHVNWAFVEENFKLKRIPNMSHLMIDVDRAKDNSAPSYM